MYLVMDIEGNIYHLVLLFYNVRFSAVGLSLINLLDFVQIK